MLFLLNMMSKLKQCVLFLEKRGKHTQTARMEKVVGTTTALVQVIVVVYYYCFISIAYCVLFLILLKGSQQG